MNRFVKNKREYMAQQWEDEEKYISTIDGEVRCSKGDWIIKNNRGEVFLCNNIMFKVTYDRINQ
jgi:hypothetical protein